MVFLLINQNIMDVLKKFQMETATSMKTPMQSGTLIGPDLEGKPVDQKTYRGIIG